MNENKDSMQDNLVSLCAPGTRTCRFNQMPFEKLVARAAASGDPSRGTIFKHADLPLKNGWRPPRLAKR